MPHKQMLEEMRRLVEPFRVNRGKDFRLNDVNPADTLWLKHEDKPKAKELLAAGIAAMAGLQDRLYAQDKWGLLLILQAMDAAGKDGVVKHVMSGVNPQGCQVHSFKAPSHEELDHDYLWRCQRVLPNRGHIGIFNRSYYEEVLVVRVHPEFLAAERIPEELTGKKIWRRRYEEIRNFERYLAHNGVIVRKFFLHLSKKEQKKRFLERLGNPEKHWKFSAADLQEREHWPQYMEAYEDMIRHTATGTAPWYVVPADNKWFTRLVVAAAIVETLAGLDLRYPEVSAAHRKELARARKQLLAR